MKITILMMMSSLSTIVVIVITSTMALPTIITPAAVYASFSLSTGEDIETSQDEFTRNMEKAMEEVQREETAELFGGEENVPTVDEFMEGAEEEGEFDDEQQKAERQENGIEVNEEGDPIAASANLRWYDRAIKTELLNQTFNAMLNSIEEPEIETAEVQTDVGGGIEGEEESDFTERQTIFYEFNPDTAQDDIRIYTTPDQTVQSLADLLHDNLNYVIVELYDNGRAVINCDGELGFDEDDDTRIYAPHPYTPANGYQYVNNTIFDAAGNEIISDQTPSFDTFLTPEAEAAQC
jgi:hypothetical protein